MADPKFRTEITADPAPYKAGMDEAARIAQQTAQSMGTSMAGAMQGMQATMEGAFSKMNAVFAGVQKAVLGVGAVIAGGGAFAAALNKSKDLTVESQKLGRALGISATEGSILAVALGEIYQTSDVLLTANNAMTKTLVQNEGAFRALGVATRDTSTGGFRNALDIMLDVNQKLTQFREGTDRNIEGQKIYKKAWAEVAPVIKLTAEVMEQSKVKAEALNLVVGAENVAAVTKYRSSMNDVGLVMSAISKVVGDAVMPVFTDLGKWFSETGPARVELMRQAMAVLVSAFYGVKFAVEAAYYGLSMVFESLWEVVKAFTQVIVVQLLRFADTGAKALRWDFSGAKAAWQAGGDQSATIFANMAANIGKIAEKNRDKIIKSAEEARAGMVRALEGGFNPVQTTPTKRTDGGGSSGGEDKNAFAKWEAELKARRDAYDQEKLDQGSFERYTLEMERDFWAQKMVLAGGSEKLLAAASAKFYDVKRQLLKNSFDAEVAGIQAQMASAETSAEQKISLAGKVYQLEVQYNKAGSKEAIKALQDVQKAYDDWAKQRREILALQAEAEKSYQLSRVELERSHLETLEQLGIIKAAEKLQRLKDLKEIEYTIELEALNKKKDLIDPSIDPVKYEEALKKIRELKQKHNLDMAKLDDQMAIESKKNTDKWLDPIADGFQKMIDGMIAGTRKWTDVLRSVLASVAQQYAALGVKMLVEWVKTEVAKTGATVAGATARTSAETGAAAASTSSTAGTAIANIGAKAWEAAASVYASIAEIPVVGPFLAPAMAAAAAIAVLGFIGNIAHASGGYDVPRGVSPLTQLHSEEMVLPASLANAVRGMAGAGGGPGPGGGGVTVNYHDNTGTLTPDQINANARLIGKVVQQQIRTFGLQPRR